MKNSSLVEQSKIHGTEQTNTGAYSHLFLLLTVLLLVVLAGVVFNDGGVTLFGCIYFSIGYILVFIFVQSSGRKRAVRLFIWAFTIRLLCMMVYMYYQGQVVGGYFIGLQNDDRAFWATSLEYSADISPVVWTHYFINWRDYGAIFKVASALYCFVIQNRLAMLLGFEPSVLYLLLGNILIGSLCIPVAYNISTRYFRSSVAWLSGKLLCFFPGAIFLSIVLLRDIWILLIILLFTHMFLGRKYVLTGLCVVLGALFRYRLFSIFIFIIVNYYLFYLLFVRKKRGVASLTTKVLLMAFCLLLLWQTQLFSVYTFAEVKHHSNRWAQRLLTAGNINRTAMIFRMSYIPRTLALFIITFLAPIPPWSSLKAPPSVLGYRLFQDMEAIFILLSLPFLLKGVFWLWRNRRKTVVTLEMLFCFVWLLSIQLVLALTGWVSSRERLMCIPAWLILVALGVVIRREKKSGKNSTFFLK